MGHQANTLASLFVYFRLRAECAEQALARLEAMQAGLGERHPGLCARLMARCDEPNTDELTWMEIYEHPLGLSEAFVLDLEAAASALPEGLIGTRHSESFAKVCLSGRRVV